MVSFTFSSTAVLALVLAASSTSAASDRYLGCIKAKSVAEYASSEAPVHAPSLDACQTTCGEQMAMFVASSLTCSCADAATTFLPSDHAKTATSGACIKDDAIVTSPAPAPLRVQKPKRKHASSEKQRAGGELCPKGQKACNNPETKSFDCVNVKTSLAHCGACVFGEFDGSAASASTRDQDPFASLLGQNCDDVVGIASGKATCQQGRCVAKACAPGWVLWDGECV